MTTQASREVAQGKEEARDPTQSGAPKPSYEAQAKSDAKMNALIQAETEGFLRKCGADSQGKDEGVQQTSNFQQLR